MRALHRVPQVIVAAILAGLTACAQGPADGTLAYGTVEVHEANLGSPLGGRVVRMLVEEGDPVAAGDTIALLTQTDLDASLAGYRARVSAAEARLRDLRAGARDPEIGQAEAERAGAEAEVRRAGAELRRIQSLTEANLASHQQLDDATTASRVAEERLRAAEERLHLVRAGARENTVAAAAADVANARAALRAAEDRASDLVLTASVDGVVLQRLAEPGEIMGPGQPLVTVGEVGAPWVKAWMRAEVVEHINPGDPVVIQVGDHRVHGRIVAIQPQAEFTPRVALTERERADLMFGVRVEPTDSVGLLKPGLWVAVQLDGPNPSGGGARSRGTEGEAGGGRGT